MHRPTPSQRNHEQPSEATASAAHRVIAELIEMHAASPMSEQRALSGETVRHPPPLGYRRVGADSGRQLSEVEIDPATAAMVVWLFSEYASGVWSLRDLSKAAKQRWSRLARTYGRSGSFSISASGLAELLHNDHYLGFCTHRHRKFRGTHEAIIAPDLFDAVQDMLHTRAAHHTDRQLHIDSDVLQCGRCGEPLRSHAAVPTADATADSDSSGACPGVDVSAAKISGQLAAVVNELVPAPDQIAAIRAYVAAHLSASAALQEREQERQRMAAAGQAVVLSLDLLALAPDRLTNAPRSRQSEWITTIFDRVVLGPEGVTSVDLTSWYSLVLDPDLLRTPPIGRDAGPEEVTDAVLEPARPPSVAANPWTRIAAWVRRHTLMIALVNVMMWWLSVRNLRESEFDDLGLLGALPLMAVIAPLVAIGLIAVTVSAGRRARLISAHVACLVMTLYGLGVVSGTTLQARIVLRHEGVADAVLRTGSVNPEIDAYFNWPGFFTFLAYARDVAGLHDFADLALWAPVLTNFLYIMLVAVIARAVGLDPQTVWTAVVVFLLANWVGQDYLSPQAISYVVYLTIIAALLVGVGREVEHEPRRALSMVAGSIALFAVIVPSHQLSPIMVTASVVGLVVTRRIRAKGLPILMTAMLLSWLVFMSATYLAGNLRQMLDLVGDLGAARDANLTERLGGSSGHRQVVRLRLLHTGAIALLAGCGWLRSLRTGRHLPSITVLAAVPVAMLFLQPYGGEMILRVYFFALPFLAIYVALAVPMVGTILRRRAPTHVALAAIVTVTLVLFFVTRYGNTRLDVFSRDEKAGVAALYETAPPGSLILAAVDNLPWKDRGYELFDHETISRRVIPTLDPRLISQATLATMFADRTQPSYFVATRSQETYVEMLGGLPPGAIAATESALRAEPEIRVILDQPTIRIYELPAEEAGTP